MLVGNGLVHGKNSLNGLIFMPVIWLRAGFCMVISGAGALGAGIWAHPDSHAAMPAGSSSVFRWRPCSLMPPALLPLPVSADCRGAGLNFHGDFFRVIVLGECHQFLFDFL